MACNSTSDIYDLSITFYDEQESAQHSRKFNTKVSHLDNTKVRYTKCKVSGLADKKTLWIVYGEERFYGQYKTVYPEKNGIMISVGFPIQSAQAFNCAQDCLALFPNNNFKGGLTVTDRGLDVVEKVYSGISYGGTWHVKDETGNGAGTFSGIQEVTYFNSAGMSVEKL